MLGGKSIRKDMSSGGATEREREMNVDTVVVQGGLSPSK